MYILDHYYHDNLFKVYILDPHFRHVYYRPRPEHPYDFSWTSTPRPAAYNYLDPHDILIKLTQDRNNNE